MSRRILRNAFVLVLAAALLPPAAALAQQPRIAVLGFQNASSFSAWGPKLGKAATDELTTQLVKTGKFAVIERNRIDAVLAEQHLGMSGAIDPATAVQIGKLLGAQLVVLGSVTQFSINTKSAGFGVFSASYSEAESKLDVRVVDTRTGQILVAADGGGKKRFGGASYKDIDIATTFDAGVAQEALRPAVEQTVEKIVKQRGALAKAAPALPAHVVGSNGTSIYIDQGQNFGVAKGQRFDVYRVVDQIKDANGNVLDNVTKKVGVLEVTRVLSKSSICAMVEGEAQEGDTAKPAAKSP